MPIAYIEDIVHARRRVFSSLGPNIYFTAAPPLLLCGSSNSELLKNTFALTGWANSALTEEEKLDILSDIALGVILENSHGGTQLDGTSRVRLPTSISSLDPSKIWTVGSNMKLPNMTAPPSEEQEERVVLSLIKKLKLNLTLDLDENPCMNRNPGPMVDNNGEHFYLIVGSSNARKQCRSRGCRWDSPSATAGEPQRRVQRTWRGTSRRRCRTSTTQPSYF